MGASLDGFVRFCLESSNLQLTSLFLCVYHFMIPALLKHLGLRPHRCDIADGASALGKNRVQKYFEPPSAFPLICISTPGHGYPPPGIDIQPGCGHFNVTYSTPGDGLCTPGMVVQIWVIGYGSPHPGMVVHIQVWYSTPGYNSKVSTLVSIKIPSI